MAHKQATPGTRKTIPIALQERRAFSSSNAGFIRYCWAFAIGLLLAFSFPLFNWTLLAWLAPGLILLCCVKTKKSFRIGYCAGIAHYGLSLAWLLQNPIKLYGISSWLAVGAILSGFLASWSWFCSFTYARFTPTSKRRLFVWPFLCAVAWVTMEMIVARFLTGFPWNLLAATQHQFIELIQVASVTGVYGVSFLVIWVSVALIFAIAEFRKFRTTRAWLILAAPVTGLIATLLFGWQQLSYPHKADRSVTIALIQPSIPQPVIWDPGQETNRFEQLIALSRRALESKPDIIAWPEAALPKMMSRLNKTAVSAINDLATTHNVWMILGANDIGLIRKDGVILETNRLNSAFLVDPKGDLVGRYFKRHLVPFGEFTPFRKWVPKLESLRKSGRSITAGTNPIFFQLQTLNLRIAANICFEDIFPHVIRLKPNESADLLFNLTNDGWFGDGSAPWQHAASAMFRAIENGRPLVRCANNGISCWIDERGRWHNLQFPDGTSIYGAGFKLAKVSLPAEWNNHITIYRRFGDWFGWGCVAIVCIASVSLYRSKRAGGCKNPQEKTAHLPSEI